MITLESLTNKITKRISDYIEFSVNEIFYQGDYISIFGGSVRDSIANLEIHDIDILCMPKSAVALRTFLQNHMGYEMLNLYDQDSLNLYKDISVISEPWTLMNKNKKIIQIIRPRFYNSVSNVHDYKTSYLKLLKNVDISSCGVFIEWRDDTIILKESCKNAIIHCISKKFEINEWSSFYHKSRIDMRKYKLIDRGWADLSLYTDKELLIANRSIKLNSLKFKPEYNYKIWTEQEYLNHEKYKKANEEYPF